MVEEFQKKYNLDIDEEILVSAFELIESKRKLVYGMSGKMGSGKDTVGQAIAESLKEFGYYVYNISFAEELRREIDAIVTSEKELSILADEYSVTVEEVEKLKKMLSGDSIYDRTLNSRNAVQYWGTDVRRKQDEDYWVKKTLTRALELIHSGLSVCITDVRFPNEAKAVESLQGKIVRMNVDEELRLQRLMARDGKVPTYEQMNHPSEVSLDNIDFEIMSDGKESPSVIGFEIALLLIREDKITEVSVYNEFISRLKNYRKKSWKVGKFITSMLINILPIAFVVVILYIMVKYMSDSMPGIFLCVMLILGLGFPLIMLSPHFDRWVSEESFLSKEILNDNRWKLAGVTPGYYSSDKYVVLKRRLQVQNAKSTTVTNYLSGTQIVKGVVSNDVNVNEIVEVLVVDAPYKEVDGKAKMSKTNIRKVYVIEV